MDMDITYENKPVVRKEFIEQSFNSYSFRRCDIRNSQFIHMIFGECNFSRSSLVCLRIQECVFDSCDLRNVDFKSCKITKTIFKNCKFMLAQTNDNTFVDSEFIESDFTGASIQENIFINCKFIHIDLNGSSTILNHFRQPKIIESIFGNCTIDYNIMETPVFQNSHINEEMLGSSFGISKNDLQGVSFIVLGNEITVAAPDIFENIYQDFLEGHLYIEAFVFEICFYKKNILSSMDLLIQHINKKIDEKEYFIRDELRYLFNIIKELHMNGELPFLALHRLLKCIKDIISEFNNDELPIDKYILFYNNLYLMYNSMIKELNESDLTIELGECGIVTVELIFKQRPTLEINTIMNNIHEYIYGNKPKIPAYVVEEKVGSYIVVMTMMIATLAAFNLGTYLLVGGLKHLIKARAAVEVLTSKKLPKKYYNEIYNDDKSLQLSCNILNILNSVVNKKVPNQIDDLPQNGINNDNLKNTTVQNIDKNSTTE